MTQSYILICNEMEDVYQTWYRNTGLTKGIWQDPIVQLFNEYEIGDFHSLVDELQNAGWRKKDALHPAAIIEVAEKLVFIHYDEKGKLVRVKSINVLG